MYLEDEVETGVGIITGTIISMGILNREDTKKTTTTMVVISITLRVNNIRRNRVEARKLLENPVAVPIVVEAPNEAGVPVAVEGPVAVAAPAVVAVQAVAAVQAAVVAVVPDAVAAAVAQGEVVAAVAVAAAVVEADDLTQASSSKEVSRALFIESSFVNQNVGVSPISASHR